MKQFSALAATVAVLTLIVSIAASSGRASAYRTRGDHATTIYTLNDVENVSPPWVATMPHHLLPHPKLDPAEFASYRSAGPADSVIEGNATVIFKKDGKRATCTGNGRDWINAIPVTPYMNYMVVRRAVALETGGQPQGFYYYGAPLWLDDGGDGAEAGTLVRHGLCTSNGNFSIAVTPGKWFIYVDICANYAPGGYDVTPVTEGLNDDGTIKYGVSRVSGGYAHGMPSDCFMLARPDIDVPKHRWRVAVDGLSVIEHYPGY